MIRFDNFAQQTAALRPQLDAALARVLDSHWYILGSELAAFEEELARYLGLPFAVGVASGTEAIALALMSRGIGKGDEVLVPAVTAFPTITAIVQSGAVPVVVDVLPQTGLMDPDDAEKRISRRTRAILPVHLYGQSADLAALQLLADAHGLQIIEDCAQAIGARFGERRCGAIGVCAAFSFYPTKNLGAYGDGGAVTTGDEETHQRLLKLRNYGQSDRYHHVSPGINSRLDEMQAALLRVKLPYLEDWTTRRRALAARYRELLPDWFWMREEPYGEAVYHLFALRHPRRDQLIAYLRANGVQALIHYPVPVHRQPAFPGRRPRLKAAEAFAREIFSIPLYPELTGTDQERVAELIRNFG